MPEVNKGVIKYSNKLDGMNYFTINSRVSNFRIKEFACKDGSDLVLVDCELVEKLQIIREYFGVPVIINSAYRTETYNKQVGGADGSYHKLGKAADIVVSGISPKEVASFARSIGFRGVGTYKNFVHVDTRPTISYWNG